MLFVEVLVVLGVGIVDVLCIDVVVGVVCDFLEDLGFVLNEFFCVDVFWRCCEVDVVGVIVEEYVVIDEGVFVFCCSEIEFDWVEWVVVGEEGWLVDVVVVEVVFEIVEEEKVWLVEGFELEGFIVDFVVEGLVEVFIGFGCWYCGVLFE